MNQNGLNATVRRNSDSKLEMSEQLIGLFDVTSDLMSTGIRTLPAFTAAKAQSYIARWGVVILLFTVCFMGILSLLTGITHELSLWLGLRYGVTALFIGAILLVVGSISLTHYYRRCIK